MFDNTQELLFNEDFDAVNGAFWENIPKITTEPIESVYNNIRAYSIDISHTISELSYLTHNFYRYYGKYPSVLGGFLIDKYAYNGVVFDNYLGSGTTSVEAFIRGLKVSGIDVNPIAVLSSNVKTRIYKDIDVLYDYFLSILNDAKGLNNSSIKNIPKWKDIGKWFSEENIIKLAKLQNSILSRNQDETREIAVVCFLSIIRRCSNAYDGEVRPHFNPTKKPRDPFEAFKDKYSDMLSRLKKLKSIVPVSAHSRAFCASNLTEDLSPFIPFGKPSLTISHPPYLNCFNYYAVFNLENKWSYLFPEARQGVTEDWIGANEHICWPATKETILKSYFKNLGEVYSTLRKNVEKGSNLAIIIGDSTIHKKLINVQKRLIEELPNCGYEPFEIIYRTTHYGIGKYAYRSRADYHGEGTEKRDGVIMARAI
jgi:hypothetical protein